MKHLILLFAVIFAGIVIVPCQDAAASETACGTEIDEQDAADLHSDETAEDLCSPFCACHCCHIHKVKVAASVNTLVPLAAEESKAALIHTLLSKDFFSIWHPPKV
jgi:hypothetical protein